jgi:hypothetical protein
LAQGKDLRVCCRIGLTDALVEPSADNLSLNDNHGSDRHLIQLKRSPGLHQSFPHEGYVDQFCFLKPMIAVHFQIYCSRFSSVIAARENPGRRSRPEFKDFWIPAFAGMTDSSLVTRHSSLVSSRFS